jgi:hypothetical protein
MRKHKPTELFGRFATILGHLTGRMLLRRPGYEVDIDAILSACAEHGVAIEINASPHRLDLDWRWHRRALELGCMFSINPDAHSIEKRLERSEAQDPKAFELQLVSLRCIEIEDPVCSAACREDEGVGAGAPEEKVEAGAAADRFGPGLARSVSLSAPPRMTSFLSSPPT